MPTKKATTKNLVNDVTDIRKRVTALSKDVTSVLSRVKKSYRSLDPKTKQRIALGIAGLGAVLTAASIYRRRKNRR